jgi:hypothetical protein
MAAVAQPSFVPVPDADKVRATYATPVPVKARTGRPGELRAPAAPRGTRAGSTGPDQGYALTLARRLAPRLHLTAGEDRHDAERAVALLGSKRASLAGRAPCATDLLAAAEVLGLLGEAPDDLVARRKALLFGLAHSYAAQRALADAVPDEALASAAGTQWWREDRATEEDQ